MKELNPEFKKIVIEIERMRHEMDMTRASINSWIWNIQDQKADKQIVTKKLDVYEDYPNLYKKMYFNYFGKKVMTYIMPKKTTFKNPTTRYLNIIIQGYKDCKLDEKYLNKALKPSW